jgi:hypothetical protein
LSRRALVLLCLAAALTGLTSCTSESTTSAGDARSDEVEKAYLRYWEVLLEASNPPAPDDERLPSVAADPQLRDDRLMLEERAHADRSATGDYQHDYSVTEVTSSEATLEDCLTAEISLTGPEGQITAVPPGPYAVRASLIRQDGAWRVAELESSSAGCDVPPPSSVPTPPASDASDR